MRSKRDADFATESCNSGVNDGTRAQLRATKSANAQGTLHVRVPYHGRNNHKSGISGPHGGGLRLETNLSSAGVGSYRLEDTFQPLGATRYSRSHGRKTLKIEAAITSERYLPKCTASHLRQCSSDTVFNLTMRRLGNVSNSHGHGFLCWRLQTTFGSGNVDLGLHMADLSPKAWYWRCSPEIVYWRSKPTPRSGREF
jgi:hypothetical protein